MNVGTFREGLNWFLETLMDILRFCSSWLRFELFLFHSLLEQVIEVEVLKSSALSSGPTRRSESLVDGPK